jgi:hypothetical protein
MAAPFGSTLARNHQGSLGDDLMSSVAEGPLANVRAVVERAKTREPDPDDRRASRVALTTAGKRKLTAALKTYEAEVAGILGGVLRPEEQQQMSD